MKSTRSLFLALMRKPKSSNISIGTIIKNPEMLKFIPKYFKTKKVCKHTFKKIPFVIRYVPYKYKTQEMCDKDAVQNGGTLAPVPDCYKD